MTFGFCKAVHGRAGVAQVLEEGVVGYVGERYLTTVFSDYVKEPSNRLLWACKMLMNFTHTSAREVHGQLVGIPHVHYSHRSDIQDALYRHSLHEFIGDLNDTGLSYK